MKTQTWREQHSEKFWGLSRTTDGLGNITDTVIDFKEEDIDNKYVVVQDGHWPILTNLYNVENKKLVLYCLNKIAGKISSLDRNNPNNIPKHIKYLGLQTNILTADKEEEIINFLLSAL